MAGKEISPELSGKPESSSNGEILANRKVEIRFGTAERDYRELARLFTQRSALPHLSGVCPDRLSDEEREFIDRRYPGLPIMAATPADVRKYYRMNEGLVLIVAEESNDRKKLLGSVTVQTGNVGVLAANISRLVVDEEKRGRGVGRRLIRAANAYIFGSLGFHQANASIILGVPGDEIPQRIFRSEQYVSQNEQSRRCVSWDPDKNFFVVRNVLPMVLERNTYLRRYRNRESIERQMPVDNQR